MDIYLKYSRLERYLFEDVHRRFHAQRYLDAFDFFSIVIWKANRSKSTVARRLRKQDANRRRNLNAIVRTVTRSLFKAPDDKARMRVLLIDWRLRIPMASAILTVLWPDAFTVYDERVCREIDGFTLRVSSLHFDKTWDGYREYLRRVRRGSPRHLSLRDKDRYLWGKSRATQLRNEVAKGFPKRRRRRA